MRKDVKYCKPCVELINLEFDTPVLNNSTDYHYGGGFGDDDDDD